MLQMKSLMHKALITIAGATAVVFTAFASSGEKPAFAPQVPHPTNGSTECVEPVDDMKKNHMEYLLHQRDKTVHEGVRTKQHSLKACIDCHVPENTEVRFGDDKHFCSSCHNYTGVSIDCFQCHTDRPVGKNPHKSDAQLDLLLSTDVVDKSVSGVSNE